MEEEKLLPCPFCGGEAADRSRTKDRQGMFDFWIGCGNVGNCFVTPNVCGDMANGTSKQKIINDWNTRTPSVTVDMEKRLQEAFSMGWNSCMLTEDRGGVNRHIKFIMFLERYRSAIKDPSAIKEG